MAIRQAGSGLQQHLLAARATKQAENSAVKSRRNSHDLPKTFQTSKAQSDALSARKNEAAQPCKKTLWQRVTQYFVKKKNLELENSARIESGKKMPRLLRIFNPKEVKVQTPTIAMPLPSKKVSLSEKSNKRCSFWDCFTCCCRKKRKENPLHEEELIDEEKGFLWKDRIEKSAKMAKFKKQKAKKLSFSNEDDDAF